MASAVLQVKIIKVTTAVRIISILFASMQRMGDSSIHFALLVSGNLCGRQGNNQTPSEAPDAACHHSGKQEMDVLHFAAHNICRGTTRLPRGLVPLY